MTGTSKRSARPQPRKTAAGRAARVPPPSDMARWAAQVREAIAVKGGTINVGTLGGRVKLPASQQGCVKYRVALESNGFIIAGETVRCAAIGMRRSRDDEDEEDGSHRQRRQRTDSDPSPFEAGAARTPGSFNWSKFTMRALQPAGPRQSRYKELLCSKDVGIVVGVGPAGCGKTLFAVQAGLSALRSGQVERLILARPNVLAGEELGFLPGTEKSKLEPLLAPALDAITKVMGPKAWDALHKAGLLEFQSFAYMRGRTHDHAFVVADEIQNASFVQLKMLATRVGANSKLCILGDPTQFDRRDNWANSPLNLFAKAVTEKQQAQSAWQIDADPAADHAQAIDRM